MYKGTVTEPCEVSVTHSPFSCLIDRKAILAHLGRFSKFKTNLYTTFGSHLIEMLVVLDFNTVIIFDSLFNLIKLTGLVLSRQGMIDNLSLYAICRTDEK